MKKINRDIVALALNILIIIFEIIAFSVAIPALGWSNLLYYTQWSNFLLMLAAIAFSFYLIQRIKGKKNTVPGWAHSFKTCSTLSVTVTFIVVITVLSWSTGYGLVYLMTYSSMLYLHTLCPILALTSFFFFEEHKLTEKHLILKTLAFTIVYASIMLPLNILKIVDGPYPFLRVHQQPVWASILWIVLIMGGASLLAKAFIFAKQKLNRN